jgi:hypothetical protein
MDDVLEWVVAVRCVIPSWIANHSTLSDSAKK